jgi:hypothetical protein
LLRNLPDDQRSKLVFSTEDVRVIDAVLTAPPELSGVPKDRFDFLLEQRLKSVFGAEIAAIERDEAALENAEAASAVARNDLRATLDPDAQDARLFETIMAGISGVPWLMKSGSSIVVVKIDDQGRASYPTATPDEEAAGRFFANRQEYEAANA